jgi:hypothetical protein
VKTWTLAAVEVRKVVPVLKDLMGDAAEGLVARVEIPKAPVVAESRTKAQAAKQGALADILDVEHATNTLPVRTRNAVIWIRFQSRKGEVATVWTVWLSDGEQVIVAQDGKRVR